MFKRVIWMGFGAAAGSATTVWTQRKVKSQLQALSEKTQPAQLVASAKSVAENKSTNVVASVVDAFAAGRETMRDSEAELQQRLWKTESRASDNVVELPRGDSPRKSARNR